MIKVGITGVHGFVGSALYEYLRLCNYEVVGFSRTKDCDHCTYFDLTKEGFVHDSDIDVLIHAAGIVDDWISYEECFKNNCDGTRNTLNSFPGLKKYIYISSCSVYDPTDTSFIINESSPCGHFLNGYSRSKYEAEQIIMHHESACQKIILRPHIIYGSGDKKIIPRLLQAHRFNRFIVLGDGENIISVTHIDNLCQAVEKSIGISNQYSKEIFTIVDKELVVLRELIAQVKKKFKIQAKNLYVNKKIALYVGIFFEIFYRILGSKNPPPITRYVVHQMTACHSISIDKAHSMLHYTPTKTFLDL